MPELLYIESSPRKDRSKSIGVARAFIDAYQAEHADDTVTSLDLWTAELPEFDGATINAKYKVMHGKDHTDAEKNAWDEVSKICGQFTKADKYLFSVPMWNFGIPYKLKHYIDLIAQPGLTFRVDPEQGYQGLVTGKPAVVVYARGGAYGDDSKMDFQMKYMELLLGFVGFKDMYRVVIEPTAGAPDTVAAAEADARTLAESLARSI